MGEGTPYLQKFIESTELLADKLGPAFLTLPPSFKPVVFPAIVKFIERWIEIFPHKFKYS